ncbi:MAG: hypothetical protein IPO08_20270 [Xanthomonadales bacterium]|nr:hypothetical protein [Xanthomonadales bacterium]
MSTTNKPHVVYWRPSVETLVKQQAEAAGMKVSAYVNQLVIDEQIRINNRRERDERKQLAQVTK